MLDVRKLLAQRPLLFDGGMGTYYKAKPGQECEQANLTDPEGILAVHRAYLAAGADAIKTNTFSLPRLAAAQQPGWEQLADAGWQLAVKAAGETGAAVFATLALRRIPKISRRSRCILLWQSALRCWVHGIFCLRP
mgnify:CR=1 FL=1